MVALEAAGLLRHLSRDEMTALRQITQERLFVAGREIFKEGDPGHGVCMVKEGQAGTF